MSLRHVLIVLAMTATMAGLSVAQRPLIQGSDPAVQQTIRRADRGPTEFGKSVSALTRMGEFAEVERLLESFDRRNFNEDQKALIATEISPAERLRLIRHPEISTASVKRLDELFESRGKRLADPARIATAVETIGQTSGEASLPAIRILFEGAEASTAALAGAIAQTDDTDQRDRWLRAMLRIDEPSGIEALRRIALYGTDSARGRAIAALIRLGGDAFVMDFATEVFRYGDSKPGSITQPGSIAQTDSAKRVLEAWRARGIPQPSYASVRGEFRDQLSESNRVATRGLRDIGRTRAWMINPNRDGVTAITLPDWLLRYRDAADSAARLIAIGDNDPESVIRQWIAQVAYAVANNPDWGTVAEVESFTKSFGIETTPQLTRTALELATRVNNDPAMIGLLRSIVPAGTTDTDPGGANPGGPDPDWLMSDGPTVSPLVTAVDHPSPVVRYEAAAAIARLNPRKAFAGQSRVRARLTQMSQLGQRATAIVLENRPEIVSQWARIMNQAGLDATIVDTVRQLERVAASGDDLRIIISKREPKDAAAVELVDMVRRISVARDVPIVFCSDRPPVIVELKSDPSAEERDPEADAELNAGQQQALLDDASVIPDRFGVIGGINNIKGVVYRDLLYGDLDVDSTVRRPADSDYLGVSRWVDESIRAGLIRQMVRPQSVAGLYEVFLESRRRLHLPPLSPIDHARYRELAITALAEMQSLASG